MRHTNAAWGQNDYNLSSVYFIRCKYSTKDLISHLFRTFLQNYARYYKIWLDSKNLDLVFVKNVNCENTLIYYLIIPLLQVKNTKNVIEK